MKKKGIIVTIAILAVLTIVLIILFYFKQNKIDVNMDVKNITLVYRSGNYAYDRKDDLYTIERDGTIRYHDMKKENINTTLISIVIALLQDSDSIVGTSEEIPEDILEAVELQNLTELKYKSELGDSDAPDTVYYILVETNTSIELINIASYSGRNKLSDFKLRQETIDFINSAIKDVK
ncbi:hypothetical protein [Ruminococcus albus]|uniref:DUF4340 domain-containing protein n=1 Tax=Ruminococcus albus TaxID=1264 RepID=A0A1I1Q9G1_RUMAL|nr:hypothetical protein [Ruminococcus albus]SFD18741.1 hypothetical protein SAMN02910406_03336 [Ruminococcus albus]